MEETHGRPAARTDRSPRSVFEVECIDRMYLNVYVPSTAVRHRPW